MTNRMTANVITQPSWRMPANQTVMLNGTGDVDIVTVQKVVNPMTDRYPRYTNANATLNDITLNEIPNGATLKVSHVHGVTTYILANFNTKVDKLMLDGKEYTLDEILNCGGAAGTPLCQDFMQRKSAAR